MTSSISVVNSIIFILIIACSLFDLNNSATINSSQDKTDNYDNEQSLLNCQKSLEENNKKILTLDSDNVQKIMEIDGLKKEYEKLKQSKEKEVKILADSNEFNKEKVKILTDSNEFNKEEVKRLADLNESNKNLLLQLIRLNEINEEKIKELSDLNKSQETKLSDLEASKEKELSELKISHQKELSELKISQEKELSKEKDSKNRKVSIDQSVTLQSGSNHTCISKTKFDSS